MYDQSGYNAFPQPVSGYPPGGENVYAGPPGQQPPTPYVDPNAPYANPQAPYAHPYATQQAPRPFSAGPDPSAYTAAQHQQPVHQAQPQSQPQSHPQALPQQHAPAQSQLQPQAQHNGNQELMPQGQAQGQAQQQQQGPPYVYDPNATYADPNVQAWAQYYAQGGTDSTGAVYFISIPGITDNLAQGHPGPQTQTQSHIQDQTQPQHQPQPVQQPQLGSPAQGGPAQGSPAYQPYPAQQPANEIAGYSAAQLNQNPSVTSIQTQPGSTPGPVGYSGAGNTSPQSAHAPPQHSHVSSSPTSQHAPSYFQPTSPGGTSHAQPQQYPPNPYPVDPRNVYTSPIHDGPAQTPFSGPDPQAQYGAQYTQMQGQFGGMGIADTPTPTGVPQTAQMA